MISVPGGDTAGIVLAISLDIINAWSAAHAVFQRRLFAFDMIREDLSLRLACNMRKEYFFQTADLGSRISTTRLLRLILPSGASTMDSLWVRLLSFLFGARANRNAADGHTLASTRKARAHSRRERDRAAADDHTLASAPARAPRVTARGCAPL